MYTQREAEESLSSPCPPPHSQHVPVLGPVSLRSSRVSNLHEMLGCWGFIIIVINKSNNYQELPFLFLPREGGGATPAPPVCPPGAGDGRAHASSRQRTHAAQLAQAMWSLIPRLYAVF